MTSDITAERIKDSRTKIGLSGQSLAEAIGVTQTSISRYETGKKKPSFRTLKKISRTLNVSTDYLMGLSEESEPPAQNEDVMYTVKAPRMNTDQPDAPKITHGDIPTAAAEFRGRLKQEIYHMDADDLKITHDVLVSCIAMLDSLRDTEKQVKTA
ncbi:MAG: helix-turn-helix domain-containing protein [Cloacibacillus sp.]